MAEIAITGAKGQLGRELAAQLAGRDVAAFDLPEHDITLPGFAAELARAHPRIVIHAAAMTDVDGCETDPDRARKVNAEATAAIASASSGIGTYLVYLSTDYIFDGKKGSAYIETDPPNPLSVYGRTKWEGEEAVRALETSWLIVRTAWMYGQGSNFVRAILEKARAGGPIRVVADQIGSPTSAQELARVLAQLIGRRATGIFHAAGVGACSRFELAAEALRLAGLKSQPIPITTAEAARPAPRPACSALGVGKLFSVGVRMRPWRDCLREYIESQP